MSIEEENPAAKTEITNLTSQQITLKDGRKLGFAEKAVKLPDDQQVYGALMLGYPKYRFRRIPLRNPARITWE